MVSFFSIKSHENFLQKTKFLYFFVKSYSVFSTCWSRLSINQLSLQLFNFSDHYWPMDTVPVYYGDIKITLLNDSHYPDWIVTEFMMQRVKLEEKKSS